jgi:hypothetical protein
VFVAKAMNTTITQTRREELTTKIEPLRQQVEAWRKNRPPGQRMPEPLWEAATALAKEFGVSPVQRVLRVDYRGLEYRATGVDKSKPAQPPAPNKSTFVELPALAAPRRAEHTIELEDESGRKMTVKVCGGSLTELLPLAQAFWRPAV